ncbi:uncharacterized protein [Antedon mediterranea]|uniref:uncharacterized protein n=1 Tax=Antedon mediterranea TaxID=105859 RepID=UPI003AF8DD31
MACVRLSCSFTLITAIQFLLNLSKVSSNSYFEIKLNSFSNDAKVDNIGQCCTGNSDYTNHCNSSVCRTFFQICLTNYQVDIPMSPECTFGRQVTPVIGENTFNDSFQNEFVNPIRIPMEFVWPGDFLLIIEAMHDASGVHVEEGSERKLLTRLAMTDAIDASKTWTNSTHMDQNHTLHFSYRVVCNNNRYGPQCATECTPRDNYFSHYTCDSEGNKVCLDGWTGPNCITPVCDECVHGYCTAPNQCECQAGWKGEQCDECITHPSCDNGFCYTAFQCICKTGWRGVFCNFDATFCTENNPCRHGGICEHTDNGSGYQCNCPTGTTGSHCEILEADNSCQCENGATCRFVDDGVQVCDCPTGYFGSMCENYDNCQSIDALCQNGGTCSNGEDTYLCACPDGFIGNNCETNICLDNPCLNGGTCMGLEDSMRCDCPTGYSGIHCQILENACLLQPCANGGICFILENDYRCNCPEGFEGKDCSVNINECASNPCKNGATCKDLVNNFECICTQEWQGELCDHVSDIMSTTLENDQPTQESIHVTHTKVLQTKKPVSNDNLQLYNQNESTDTELKQILIYCFCGLLIVLIIILLCIIVYRKKQINTDDIENRPCDSEPNNKKVYTDNFTQQKKVLPLSSISIKVCNEESDSYSKGTSKQFSNFEDYKKDIYSQVLKENSDSLSEKISKHSYKKKIPERRKHTDICQVESYSPVLIKSDVQGKQGKQLNISENSTLRKEQCSKADCLATQV